MDARIAIQRIGPLGVLGVASVSVVAAKLYVQMRRGALGIFVARHSDDCWHSDPIVTTLLSLSFVTLSCLWGVLSGTVGSYEGVCIFFLR